MTGHCTGLKPDTQYEVRLLAATQKGFPPEDDWQWSFHKTLEASPSKLVHVHVFVKTG